MKLYLIRHAKSLRAKMGAFGRTVDVDIDQDFLSQCDEARSFLALRSFEAIATSPLARCRSTLKQIFGTDRRFTEISDFRAYHSGALEDKSEEFVIKMYPGYENLPYRDRFLRPKFGEESITEQAIRVRRGLNTLLEKCSGGDVCICTHYSVINIIGHLAAGNMHSETYGDGSFDVPEGGFIALDGSSLNRSLMQGY